MAISNVPAIVTSLMKLNYFFINNKRRHTRKLMFSDERTIRKCRVRKERYYVSC